MRTAAAFAFGLVAGAAASVAYLGSGATFGDADGVYYAFHWRGRRIQLNIDDRL